MLSSCRICLKGDTDLLKTSTLINNVTYDEELSFCVPEIDWASSNVPSLICCTCTKHLEITASFRRLCLESNETRKKFIENKTAFLCNQANVESKLKVELVSNLLLEVNESSNDEDSQNVFCDNDTQEAQKSAKRRKLSVNRRQQKENTLKLKHGEKDDNHGLHETDSMKLYVPNKQERICIFCSTSFSKYSTLVNHVRSVHTFEKCFKCDICDEGFTNSEILSRHKNRHTGDRKYVCSYCGKKFFTNSDLNHHVQRHQNKRNYKCDVCKNKSFNTANSLRTHKLVVHTKPNEWKYLCTICGRKCVTQAALNVHTKRHSNEKDFACHLCLKRFCTKSEVSKHIVSHSNMRLHKCDICNQEYKDRKVMERHLTKKHGIGNAKIVERVKKYFCDVCPKKFVGKRQLEKHLRSHSGERPFKCELCEQSFICRSYIKGHMRSKHSIDVQTN